MISNSEEEKLKELFNLELKSLLEKSEKNLLDFPKEAAAWIHSLKGLLQNAHLPEPAQAADLLESVLLAPTRSEPEELLTLFNEFKKMVLLHLFEEEKSKPSNVSLKTLVQAIKVTHQSICTRLEIPSKLQVSFTGLKEKTPLSFSLVVSLNTAIRSLLINSFTHSGRNKDLSIQLRFSSSAQSSLQITYQDNSDLRALQKLKKKAEMSHLDGPIEELLFKAELSSKNSHDLDSGRGLGLFGVRSLLNEVGASVSAKVLSNGLSFGILLDQSLDQN